MLNPEQAREQLNKRADDGWEKKALAAVEKLPKASRAPGWVLLDRDLEGKETEGYDWQAERALQAQAAERLDAMTPAARRAVWSAFLPKLDAGLIEAAWQAHKATPYQVGYTRKAFRAPKDPSVTAEGRFRWFSGLVGQFAKYNPDLAWVSAWAAHVDPSGNSSGPLLAAAIDRGGETGRAVMQTLRDSANGTHEVGGMGRHIVRAMLGAGDPEGWEFVEKLLLAAQRQEGLRQSILESIDEAHPGAFRQMLRLILDHDLARFSATVRALDTWFGFAWDSVSVKVVNGTIARVLKFLEDPDARAEAIVTGPAEDAYLALWSTAFEDAEKAIEPAGRLLADPDVGRRFVAVVLLGQLGMTSKTLPHLLRAIEDDDLRVAIRAVGAFDIGGDRAEAGRSDLFERAERLLDRLPARPINLDPLVWPWQGIAASRDGVASTLIHYLGDRPPSRLIRHLPSMDTWKRRTVVMKLIEAGPAVPETRELLLKLSADPSATVRQVAFEGLEKSRATPEEAARLEVLLSRKADDLRRGVLTLLANQEDAGALASVDRLLAAKKAESRRAGLELLRRLAEAGRLSAECRDRASAYRDVRPKLDDDETRQIEAVLDLGRKVATLDDALGLLDPSRRTRPVAPVVRDRPWFTPAALACLRSLSATVHEHREAPVVQKNYAGLETSELLGNIRWGFPVPDLGRPIEADAARLPLRDVWETWYASRPGSHRDADGLELIRAVAMLTLPLEADGEAGVPWYYPAGLAKEVRASLGEEGVQSLPYVSILDDLLSWLIRLHPPEGMADFLLDAVETSFANVPPEELARNPEANNWNVKRNWRDSYNSPYKGWLQVARSFRGFMSADHHVRLFRLLRWMDEPGVPVARSRPSLEEVKAALDAGGATEDDLFDHLLGPTEPNDHRHELRRISGRKPAEEYRTHPVIPGVVDRCRRRIVEVELDRGEAPTAGSGPALAIRALWGSATVLGLVHALGNIAFNRGANWSPDLSKACVLSHLIRVTFPAEGDMPAAFAAESKRLAIPPERLIELAVFAPQWARFVEQATRWPQLEEAVWWLHAHTKGNDWSVDHEIREVWTAEVAARTALGGPDLIDGAVDVAWFGRVHKALGPKRWEQLDAAARYASGGTGHTRARLFALAMLGQARKADLVGRIKTKRHADSVRSLGLLPLAKGAGRERDLLERYKVIQEFVRSSKQFGAQRQASEKRAAAIALDNLARTAGFADPIRLEWAMEAKAVADLAAGPVTVEADGVTVALAIDDQGEADLTASRDGRPLKAIPPAVKKLEKVAALVGRKGELKRQASRVRHSLEAAMCRGDAFTGDELKGLAGHAVLAPLLGRLVLIGEGIAGYPVEGGRALRDHADKLEPVKPGETLRVAHPHDLLGLGDWHLWQRDCFERERIQPFKQVFRELYVLTDAERAEGTRSLRYAGHQVNPRQALALLGGRGWVNHPEEGVRKTFHEAGLTAHLEFLEGTFTPAEVEGLTIEAVRFVRRGEWKPMPLADVPPRLFGEAMRDLDLVVSVAHRGGVDPEASASTVEMRAALLRETCQLLRLDNVRVRGSHALIGGVLGDYSLHLGSAVVHRQPGGALCIVPAHAQQRGRLFLPFADDDPKTAEVMSKALLLARDGEIQDPTILAQIRTAT